MKHGIFVTGTDTGVGKTLAACALVHALRGAGCRPVPMKPIAAGADGPLNGDTVALLAAAGLDATWAAAVTPVLLAEPMAQRAAVLLRFPGQGVEAAPGPVAVEVRMGEERPPAFLGRPRGRGIDRPLAAPDEERRKPSCHRIAP